MVIKMQSTIFLIRKIIGLLFILIYYLVVFFILASTMFDDILVLIGFIVFFGYLFIEQIYKVEPPESYKIQLRDVIIIIMFLLHPFIMVFSFYERETLILDFLPIWNNIVVKYLGLGLLLVGISIEFISRRQLGKYGTTIIIIEDDHKLIMSGIYRYIRHPIYLGSIILFTSIGIVVGSLVITSIIFLFFSFLMKDRIDLEEQLLEEKFGEEYTQYKKRTKKLIPFLY